MELSRPTKELAAEYGVNIHSVYSARRWRQLVSPSRVNWDAVELTKPIKELANETGVTEQSVYMARRKFLHRQNEDG